MTRTTYTTILLPKDGRITGACSTYVLSAASPEDAAERVLGRRWPDRRALLVTDGSYTWAFTNGTKTVTSINPA